MSDLLITIIRTNRMEFNENMRKKLLTHSNSLYCNTESEVMKMQKNTKQTSKRVASKASKVMRDGRYSKTAKSVAGSALAQTKKSGK